MNLSCIVGAHGARDTPACAPPTRGPTVVWLVRSTRQTEGSSFMASRRSLRYDANARHLRGAKGATLLRRQEARLLEYLLAHPGAWVSTETLAREVFTRANPSDASSLSLVRQHVFNLRRKLVDAGAPLSTLRSVPTLGYRLDPEAVRRA